MEFYLAGYCLIKTKPLDFGTLSGRTITTCSSCINRAPIDVWSYRWTNPTEAEILEAKAAFSIEDDDIDKIQTWSESRLETGILGWPNVFPDQQLALEFKHQFPVVGKQVDIFAIYLSELDTADFLNDLRRGYVGQLRFGLEQNIEKKVEETGNGNEKHCGFDIIGIETSGDFHSFHCHGAFEELNERFGLTLNSNGLFEEINDWQGVTNYMNNEENGMEPVPWYIVKVKRVNEWH